MPTEREEQEAQDQTDTEGFLANIKSEDTNPFTGEKKEPFANFDTADGQEKETPADPPTDKTTTDQDPSQKGDKTSTQDDQVPFHKHPRWIAQQAEKAAMEAQLTELQSFKAQVEPLLERIPKQETQLPTFWVKLYGDSEESKAAFSEYDRYQREMQAATVESLEVKADRQKQEQEALARQWEGYINGELGRLQDEGKDFDRNKLLKVVDDFSPRDKDGNIVSYIPFDKAYEIYQYQEAGTKQNPDRVEAKKKVASRTQPTAGGDTPPPAIHPVGSLANRDWFSWGKS